MPVLSFYEGYSELSFSLFNNALDASFSNVFRFPYTYSYNLFENSFTREKFYKDVFALAEKSLNITSKDYDLYNIGFLAAPDLPFKTEKSASLFSEIAPGYIYVSHQMIALKDNCFSFFALDSHSEDANFRANLDLYHNIVYYDSRDIVKKDSLLRSILNHLDLSLPQGDYVIAGDRFREFEINPVLAYLMIFDIFKSPGIFPLKLDVKNVYPHTVLLGLDTTDYPAIGTLVNVPEAAECLYESELGTTQLFDLPEDSIFILPLDQGATAKLLIKSVEYKIDTKVRGGSLGVIIDTRKKQNKTEFKEVYVNYIAQALNRI